jgi:hypothetical protein
MSICPQGMDEQLHQPCLVVVDRPLIKLMNALDWQALYALVLPDLKKTTSSLKWWLGPPESPHFLSSKNRVPQKSWELNNLSNCIINIFFSSSVK